MSKSDRVVDPAQLPSWFGTPLHVEEKLDGANVSLWSEGPGIEVASRGGAGAMDRAGQLGPLRGWAAERADQLRELLAGGWVAYGEWLWLRHSVAYDRLPDHLVVLDLWHPDTGFAAVADRDRRLAAVGLVGPPVRYVGAVPGLGFLEGLLGRSSFAGARAEGLVLRRISDGARSKFVDPSFERFDDDRFAGGERNRLAAPGER